MGVLEFFPLVVVLIGGFFIFKWARRAWRKADVEEKIEENKIDIETYQEIKKEGNEKKVEKAKEVIEKFVEDD